MTFAFSTSTSNATIPLSIDTLYKKIGVSKQISSFTIPLGATINMDGTSIMQGVAVVFIAQAYGIPLTPAAIATVIATATIASIGTAGVPSVGLVTLSMVLTSVGLPTEGIALIMGIDVSWICCVLLSISPVMPYVPLSWLSSRVPLMRILSGQITDHPFTTFQTAVTV